MVLLVRTDLQMSQGKIAAQCSHATLECYLRARKRLAARMAAQAWLIVGQPKIVLRVKDEQELQSLARQAEKIGLVVATVADAGRTQLKPGTITVAGIGPGSKEKIDSITQHLKLL
ncbi:peptidyl-tRNA hydrolase 2, mitochondrial-like [Copidosoma floridanum]|uniref:peptidyl-tRNA hydrolase 2, mitochondrial-like n=1 Tax=Copidosoma floridanum TaxID=29053 RepID=UPI0006C9DFF6|nr:peptidyl-tRNA hydrolase 2, mitochondrial-like [Copidosoma floridanum]